MPKKYRYYFEFLIVASLMRIFEIIGLDAASSLGGFIGRNIAARFAGNRKADKNLQRVFPNLNADQRKKIITDMWDNLGRTFAEYPFLEQIGRERVELIGGEYLKDLTQNPRSAIFFSGHLANWEVSAATAFAHGVKLNLVYRAANNTRVDHILGFYRSLKNQLSTSPKSSRGMRQIVDTLKSDQCIGILIDQKYNSGIEAAFFGAPAMTSPAFVQLAQKFGCALYPNRVERLNGANFRITIFPPLTTQNRDVSDVIQDSHRLLEGWITEQPAQWLWLHKRWKA